MRVPAAMSGGVDSSVAMALLQSGATTSSGHHAPVGRTVRHTGCCSATEVADARQAAAPARRRAPRLRLLRGSTATSSTPWRTTPPDRTPNPCVGVAFSPQVRRPGAARRRAGVRRGGHRTSRPHREGRGRDAPGGAGVDVAKDQSYVCTRSSTRTWGEVLMPVGELTKDRVRAWAALGLRTATKPDSQDVCFITRRGRAAFLAERMALHPPRSATSTAASWGEPTPWSW